MKQLLEKLQMQNLILTAQMDRKDKDVAYIRDLKGRITKIKSRLRNMGCDLMIAQN